MKRTPLRRVSKKTAAENRRIAPLRAAYKAEFVMCMCCRKRVATDVHEIARGSSRHIAKLHPCCWLCLCRSCHDSMGDYNLWPITRQLALKIVRDAGRFDLDEFCLVRDRAEGSITLDDIAQHLDLKQ